MMMTRASLSQKRYILALTFRNKNFHQCLQNIHLCMVASEEKGLWTLDRLKRLVNGKTEVFANLLLFLSGINMVNV